MTKPDLSEAPDFPVFRLDDVHRMQADLWQHVERVLGPCTHDYVIRPAQFVNGDEAFAARVRNEIRIGLDLRAAGEWPSCAAILGHELVHALDGISGHASVLEEGVCCLFGVGQCAAMFEEAPMHLFSGPYATALNLAVSVPNVFAVVKALRSQGLRMCDVTPQQLIAAAPTVDARTAATLCARFHPEVVGFARVHGHGS